MSSPISQQIAHDVTQLLLLSGESGWLTTPLTFGPLPGVILDIVLTSVTMAKFRAHGKTIPPDWARISDQRQQASWHRRYRLCWHEDASNPWILSTLTPNTRYAHMRAFPLFADAVTLLFDDLETASW